MRSGIWCESADILHGLNVLFQSDPHEFKWTTNVWNVQAVPQLYGLSLSGVSNIILTQGALDPWSGGGYQPGSPSANQDQGIYVMEIPGSAHHLDLRTPNTCDPNTIKNARYQIVRILDCWVHGCATPPRLGSLPQMVVPVNDLLVSAAFCGISLTTFCSFVSSSFSAHSCFKALKRPVHCCETVG
ncbi:hypothetical protein Y032_0035g3090 [Ancylostoma ceylanicum]|uniref:Serine carboxypeptidase S28 n=1 Tax=Ancylostoma ceylanicum TaxID=53326 RepID=A0A016UM75_9BILA|nr:hypothetical protein Y032_0035g3090 [Ancylostoma ceylanicum]